MSNLPKIIDNNRRDLFSVFTSIAPEYDTLSIATGYWDLKGMELVFDKIKDYKKIRLLIGREPLIPRHKSLRPEPDYPDKDFFQDLERLQPTPELKELVRSIKDLIDQGSLEVRVYRKNFLHAKCYIFGDYTSDNAVGIIGSSNFTKNGLTQNTELNALDSDHRIVTFQPQTETQEVGHLYWFDQFWNDPSSEDWNGAFTELLGHSPVGDVLYSPYETYIKTLYELYKEELEEESLDQSIKGSHDLFDFQAKNAQALVRRLNKYKVAMLADSVGLGKTYTAIEVIKQYIAQDGGQRRIEIICPKALKAQWEKELATQGVRNFSPVVLQNPNAIREKQALDKIASVSLFVIDESHNLKNRGGKRFEQIIDWMRNNPNAHVLLLTATPINNQLSDIVNQILIGTRGESDTLKVTSVDKKLKQTVQLNFYQAIENLQKKIKQDVTRDGSVDYNHIQQTMMPILRAFVVRRTRQGIQKEYGGLNIAGVERHFPTVVPEITKYGFKPEIADAMRELKSDSFDLQHIYRLSGEQILESTKDLLHPLDQVLSVDPNITDKELAEFSAVHFVYQIILLLGFVPYRWKMYQTKYYGKTKQQVRDLKLNQKESKTLFLQLSIYGILRTMFLKRMESSVSATRKSLDMYRHKLEIFRRGVEAGKIVSLKDLGRIEEQLMMGDEDFDPDDLIIDEESELDIIEDNNYNLQALKDDIDKEMSLIDLLDQQLALLAKDDSKIKSFGKLLDDISKRQPAGKKVLVFSFYADTIEYLRESLPDYAECLTSENSAFLSSKNRADAESLAGRFSPKSKKYELKADETELDYLFSTDILSEGQNLQDCGILINYDLHWNPVRMIQRNGRVNRLGTVFPKVYIYNISPEAKIEEYLQLVQRLEGKVNLIRNTIGTDSPVLDEKENPIEFADSWQDIYSESLQKRIEALENSEKEADLLLAEDEYVSALKVFDKDPELTEDYKQAIYNLPKGKWSVMPTEEHRGDPRPEVLVLNNLYDNKDEVVGHAFASMKRDGGSFQAITHLQALEWLKAVAENNERQKDSLTLEKKFIGELTDRKIEAYTEDEETGAPIGQQTEVLRILYENHFSEEAIEKVRLSFQTKNVLDKQKIRKLIRQIMKLKKSNTPVLDPVKELIDIAEKAIDPVSDGEAHDYVEQILFYAQNND